LTEFEKAASSLRNNLGRRRGLVVVEDPALAEVIVELRGLHNPRGVILVDHHLWGAVYAARDLRLPLGSPYATESWPRRSGPISVSGAINHFAADVESIVADNFEMIASLRSRPIGDTSPVEPTATAPLQGEYSLAVTPSPSCAVPSVGVIRSDYDVSLYQHGNTLLLLVRGLCRDSFSCLDKMKGQVVGDEVTLRSTFNPDFLFFPTGPTADGWVWDGKGTGHARDDRIEVTVVGKVSQYRDGEHTNERIYNCEAADHRWTLTRHK